MLRFDEIYIELLRQYRKNHQGSMDGFSDRMNQLTKTGKTSEEAVLQYALELEIEIPEIETLIDSGKSQEEAIHKIAKDWEREKQVKDVYSPSQPSPQEYKSSPTLLWYLVPVFFGLIGGIVGYVAFKDEDKRRANNLLNIGIAFTVIDLIACYYIFYIWLPLNM